MKTKPWPDNAKKVLFRQTAFRLVAWAVIPFMLLTARKAEAPGQQDWNYPNVQRYKLHPKLAWTETPDELLPGGLYEDTVRGWYGNGSWWRTWYTSWRWLAFRNVAHGLPWSLGHEITVRQVPSYEAQERIQQRGKLVIFTGWKVRQDWHGAYTKKKLGYWAMPRFSVRLATKENRARVNVE